MNELSTSIKTYVGADAHKVVAPHFVLKGYKSLLERLYPGRDFDLRHDEILRLDQDPCALIVFSVVGQTVVSTAQANLLRVEPDWNVLISNVITHEDYDGQGHGRAVMEKLHRLALGLWGPRKLTFVLTNNPSKGNAGFYEKLGWQRVPTQVWARL